MRGFLFAFRFDIKAFAPNAGAQHQSRASAVSKSTDGGFGFISPFLDAKGNDRNNTIGIQKGLVPDEKFMAELREDVSHLRELWEAAGLPIQSMPKYHFRLMAILRNK